jgi:cytochrome c5
MQTHDMIGTSDRQRDSRRVAIVLTVLVGAIATAVAYVGTREGTRAPAAAPAPPAAPAATTVAVETIALPHDETELPWGPYLRTFATSCTICHSTRMVMTQPPFPREQWVEVVHKMVKNYGAPITPEREGQIVDYLMTVRGN